MDFDPEIPPFLADAFARFLEDEMIPRIEKQYRARPFRMIFGHSYGGSFVFHVYLERPDLFGAFLAASPNLLILEAVEEKMEEGVRGRSAAGGDLFITVGEHEKDFAERISGLFASLSEKSRDLYPVTYRVLEEANHASTPHETIHDGLQSVFRLFWDLENDMDAGSLRARFARLSDKVGYEMPVPHAVLNQMGSSALSAGRFRQAGSFFRLLVERYPDSEWGYVNLGEDDVVEALAADDPGGSFKARAPPLFPRAGGPAISFLASISAFHRFP